MKKPLLSVVIPVGPHRTLDVLESLKQQTQKVEIIIEQGPNPSQNRNRGVAKAHADIIAFVDSHSILPPQWARTLLSFFRTHPSIDIVGGPQLTPPDQGVFATLSGYALSSPFGAASMSARYSPLSFTLHADERSLTSANLACRKHVFSTTLFDESLYPGEDPKFITDAKKAQYSIAYFPDLFIYHKRRSTLFAFARQIFNYGFVRPFTQPFFQIIKQPLFLIPSLFVLYIILLIPLTYLYFLFITPFFLYIALTLVFSFYLGMKHNDILAFFMLPFIFFSIHFSYGIGFILGTVTRFTRP